MTFFKTISEFFKNQINENATDVKEPIYLTKQVGNDLQYQIFRDIGNDKMQIETGVVGNDSQNITSAPISTWVDKVRHQRTRGYSKVSNLDIKHVGTASKDGTVDIPHTSYSGNGLNANIKSKYGQSTMDKLQQHDSHGVKLVLADVVQTQVDGKVKVLSSDLINEYKKYIKQLEEELKNNNLIGFNRALVKMNKIIKKKGSLTSNLVNDVSNMSKQLQKEKEILEAYLEMTVDDFDKLDNKSIKDKIENSVVLTKVNNMSDVTIEDITDAEKREILALFAKGGDEWRYVDAFKVINHRTQDIFDSELSKSKNKTTKLLFHGSKVRNWMSIIKNGLKKSNAGSNAGTLYNNGIYFADIADKSLGYVDGGRWDNTSSVDISLLAIYDVHVGKYAEYTDIKSEEQNGRVNLEKWIPKNKYDSYWAKSHNYHPQTQKDGRYNLARDEYIIYDDNKCTIKYLVEVKRR